MAAEKRKFTGSISVRIGTERIRVELAPAEAFGGKAGCFRARVNRRWHDAPDGQPLFVGKNELGALVASVAMGELPEPETAPDLPRNTRVSVNYRHGDTLIYEATWTATPPVRLADGCYYVGVMTYKAGFIFVPVSCVTRKKRHA